MYESERAIIGIEVVFERESGICEPFVAWLSVRMMMSQQPIMNARTRHVQVAGRGSMSNSMIDIYYICVASEEECMPQS